MLIFSIKSVNKLFFKKITDLKPNGEKPRSRSPGRLEASISPLPSYIASPVYTRHRQIRSPPLQTSLVTRRTGRRLQRPQGPNYESQEWHSAVESSGGLRDFDVVRCSPEEKRLRRGVGEFRVEPGFDSVIGRRNGGARGGGAGDTGGGGGVADAAGQGATQDQAEAPPGGGQRRKRRQGADGRGDRGQATPGASPEAGVFVFSLLPHVT